MLPSKKLILPPPLFRKVGDKRGDRVEEKKRRGLLTDQSDYSLGKVSGQGYMNEKSV